ncbi:unnamed protein product [Cylindrotheca closterium]|uniref:Glycosyltransferase family 92 protein n=1 Tax=Cylindrotheca closterium TaxID=2856 RepID=A0AAD2CNF2_9STRA|nr:unnamed protein product [Cylindrotheca closterium]
MMLKTIPLILIICFTLVLRLIFSRLPNTALDTEEEYVDEVPIAIVVPTTMDNNSHGDSSSDHTTGRNMPVRPKSNSNLSPEDSFAACLMWLDDYSSLNEWIAYHYQVLPLRYLVFLRDVPSQLDPTPILDKWKELIQIEYWTSYRDFMTNKTYKYIRRRKRASRYVAIQKEFYRGCLVHAQANNRTWTMVHDTDEFVVLNNKIVPNATSRMEEHGIVLEVVKKAHAKDPSVGVTGQTNVKWFANCTGMAKVQYTSFESTPEEVTKGVPYSFVDPYRFLTHRFRHKDAKGLIGKTMVDVSKFDLSEKTWHDFHSHSLIRGECFGEWGERHDLLEVNHYLGSYERFQRPSDFRIGTNRTNRFYHLNKQAIDRMSMQHLDQGDVIRPWLQGFVKHFGEENSNYLLSDVGSPYNRDTALPVLDSSPESIQNARSVLTSIL